MKFKTQDGRILTLTEAAQLLEVNVVDLEKRSHIASSLSCDSVTLICLDDEEDDDK